MAGYKLQVNPQKDGGGSNWHIAYLKACYDVLDAARRVEPSCNFHFWCLWWVRKKKIWGSQRIFFKNFAFEIFFSKNSSEQKKFFFFAIFEKKFITKHVLDGKFELRMISAFIWCIYCLCRQKISNFPKLVYQVIKNFLTQNRIFLSCPRGKLQDIGHFSITLWASDDVSCHLEPFLVDSDKKCGCRGA